QEDRDEHGVGTSGGEGLCDACIEHLRRERARSVDRDRKPDRAGEEAAAIEAGPRRERHPGLDSRESGSRLGVGLSQQGGTRELVAAISHEVCKSGEIAIRCRSAFSIRAGYCAFFQRSSVSLTARVANALSARCVVE